MQPLARAGRNTLFKTLGEVLARLSFLALFLAAARLLGAEEYGRYTYAASLTGLALVGMDLGLNTLLVRQVARQPAELGPFAGTLLLLKSLLALVVLAALALGLGLAGKPLALVLAVALCQVCWGLAELGFAGLTACEAMDREAWVKMAARLAALLAAGGLLWAGVGLWGLVTGLLLGNLLGMLAALLTLRRRAVFSLRLEAGFLRHLWADALPLALSGVFIVFYSRLDVVLLELMGRSYAEIGWYAAAARVVDGLGLLPGLVAAAWLPVLASLAGREPVALARLYHQGLRLLLLLGLPAALGLFMVREPLTELVFGSAYAPTARVFCWLAPNLALIFVNYLQLTVLTALGRQRLGALATAGALVVNVVLNLCWIPGHGIMGAAAATLATEVALLLACAHMVRQIAGLDPPWALAGRPLLATAVMGLALWLAWGLGLWGMMALGLVVYAGALLGCRAVTLGELRALRQLLRPQAAPEEAA
ncbi:MAG: oligosaccharide flippase family protein [Pseudomonadota bacterium]